jgi:Nuclease-related domain
VATNVWQRFGQLRIYVVIDDLPVGWSDPRTGRFALSQPELAPAFWAEVETACQQLRRAGRLTGPPVPPQPERSEPSGRRRSPRADLPPDDALAEDAPAEPSDPDQSWPAGDHWAVRDPAFDDLARNKPGQAARARGRELRGEHLLLTTAADLLGIRTQARSFSIGARGERVVGRRLDTWAARHGWRVLHAVPVGQRGTDIDHVVIGPFGVVTVNTKVTGTSVWVGEHGLTVGGKTVPYVRKSRAEAERARKLLAGAVGRPVPVQPAIVFVGARRFIRHRGGPPDVAVLRAPRDLHRWLRRQRRVLEPDQVELIYQAARDPASWQPRRPARRRTPGAGQHPGRD